MKIRSISIIRMPGFERGGLDLPELSDGLNLIIGPNASGKTTACRAIRGLLWPDTLEGVSPVSVEGQWVDGQRVLKLQIEGARRTCRHDGESGELPALPDSHVSRCFTITVDDLFTDTNTDSGLADSVTREMAGGYDLAAIRELDWLKLKSTHGKSQRDALKRARDQARAIRAEQESLRLQEDELADLEKREQEALDAQASRRRLDDAIELIGLQDQIAQAEKTLEAFPADMDRLRGDEAGRLKDIRADLSGDIEALELSLSLARAAQEQLARADLPQDGIPEVRLDEQRQHLNSLREAQRDWSDADKRLGEAEVKFKSALEALGDLSAAGELDSIDTAGLDDIEAFHRQAEDYKSRKSAIAGRLNALGPSESVGDADSFINGIRILREWFEAGASEPAASKINAAAAWGSVILTCILAAALTILVSPWWLVSLPLAIIPAVLAIVPGKPASSDRRAICQESYQRLDLEAPSSWDRKAVGTRLSELEEARNRELIGRKQEDLRQACREELGQLDKEFEELDARKAELAERLRIAPESSNLALVVLAERLREYRSAKSARDACQYEAERCRQGFDEQIQAVNEFLAEFGERACDSGESAEPRSEAIFKRAVLYSQARQQLIAAERDAESARKRVAKLQARKAKLFEDISLNEADEAELEDRLAKLDDFRAAVETLKNLGVRRDHLSEKLDDAPELKELSLQDAEAEKMRLEAPADSYRDLIERITEIRSRVDQAGRGDRLEAAVNGVDEARELLAECRREAELAAAGEFLLDQIETEHKAESQPEVFRRASEWFNRFTRGRYELRISDARGSGASAFCALDTSGGNRLGLDELSRGTRMQLILAVRLAFAACAERGTQLPFVLDEVLNSTDPRRFQAIAECLLTLVEEGRQIFYMTCQPLDAAGWSKVAGEMGVTNTLKLNLTDIRRQQLVDAGPLDDSTASFDPAPEPGDMTLEEYKDALKTPPLSPAAGAAANHVAHFVESPEELHRLVRADVETYGQLQSLKNHGRIDAYVSDETLARIEALACAVDAFAEAWRIGRGRSVSREILLEAGVSSNFIDRVTELARELNWDAKQLIEALESKRVARFQKAVLETVTENLVECGCLDTRDTLDRDAAYSRVLAAVNDLVKRGAIDAGEVRNLFSKLWSIEAGR